MLFASATPRHAVHPRHTRFLVPAVAGALGLSLLTVLPDAGPAGAVPARPAQVGPAPEVSPERSVPGYAAVDQRVAKTTADQSGYEIVVRVPTPEGGVALWGDWEGDGAWTPAAYLNGTWTFWAVAVGKAPAPARTVLLGGAGDVPVVGDWDGDGRSDIGVYRDGVLTQQVLRLDGSVARTTRLRYGRPGDVPVVGDWDGNRVDDIGVRRGDTFYLRAPAARLQPRPAPSPGASPSASPTTPPPPPPAVPGIPAGGVVLKFGSASDEPVVGDWNGDGRDSVGTVRGRTWLLRDDFLASAPTRRQIVPRLDGMVPLPWRTPAGETASSCPWAAAKRVQRRLDANAALVTPAVGLRQAMGDQDAAGKARSALLTAQRYLLGAGYMSQTVVRQPYADLFAPWQPNQIEYAVRIPAMRALTLAVGLSTSGYDEGLVGVPAERAQEYVSWLVRSISCEHAAFTPGGWGYGWQTAHWAMLAGLAAWLTWDELPPQAREYTATMIVAEADQLLTVGVPYWKDRGGAELSPGDTKAEENSWNGALLGLAAAMMPSHPHARLWQRKAVDYQASSFATQWDAQSSRRVNGVRIGQRLSGWNADPNGTVVNQGLVSPDYISTVQQNWWNAAFARLADNEAPEAAYVNADLVWNAFTKELYTRTDPDGTVTTSTIYRPDGQVFFPQGSRWGTIRRAQFASLDAFRLLTTQDPAAREEAWDLLSMHLDGQLALQARNPDGRTFQPGEDNYPGREEYAASMLAMAWLGVYLDGWLPIDSRDTGPYAVLPPMTKAQLSRQSLGQAARIEPVAPVGPVAPSLPRVSP
ncbi:FG-GAP repeat domain-containing protein [Motilibacter deserti]|uniref:VCBS repeat-containing protein n=1 Tax=Motilibacter deserti TaxID=2714956 RepID=A0ABX0GTW9_9ACTN|nr:VCBS repeat-containing protein [Motilibacter deserti]NHC14336.1 VCBS repeat-containing protein [Motilibacter deserti]